MSEQKIPVYKKLRAYITENGLLQKVIAFNAGMTESRLSYILSGRISLKVEDFIMICSAIGASPMKFLE